MKLPKPRRKLIVNREVQYDLLMYVSLLIAVFFVAQIFTAFIFLQRVEGTAETMSASDFIARYRISFLVYQIFPFSLCLFLGTFFFSHFSSRIAGPLYNMKKVVQRANKGTKDSVEIRLRENDYFKDEINDINAMLRRKM